VRSNLIKRVAALEEINESRRPWTPERYLQTLDDAARRIAGCQFLDLGDSDARKVFDEAMPDITAEEIEDMMRQFAQHYGKTLEEILALAEAHGGSADLTDKSFSRSLSENPARSREQSERNWHIMFYAKGLPGLPS